MNIKLPGKRSGHDEEPASLPVLEQLGNTLNFKQRRQRKKEQQRQTDAYLASPERIRQRVLGKNSSFAAVEAYKAARTNLLFTRVGDGCQTIAFTSTFAGDGKTVNCANLAKTLAQNGQKVLLIDADLRRPMVHHMFNISNREGLSEFLAGISQSSKEEQAGVTLLKSEENGFFLLPSGRVPPNPAELLASQQMKNLLYSMSQKFDYILIDTPPLKVVTDAAVLAKMISGYVLVVRAGVTSLEGLQSSVLRLEQLGANILGFILNDLDAKSGSYKYNGYRSYKYGKYGKYRYGRYGGGRYAHHGGYDPSEIYAMPVERAEENGTAKADTGAAEAEESSRETAASSGETQ